MAVAHKKKLDVVIKCDSIGSLEAVTAGIEAIHNPSVDIDIILSGVGSINKSDIFMAGSGSKLVLGFDVAPLPMIERLCKEQGIEIRLYDLVYNLTEDLRKIANSLDSKNSPEKITGRGKVIHLFKGGRKGIILGCEIIEGALARGNSFRVISAMGPIYSGRIESLQIEKRAVEKAEKGQQVGIKISNFNKAKLGDMVETYNRAASMSRAHWQPKGGVIVIS